MSYGIICKQSGCRQYAAFRFTWPGRNESHICKEHEPKLRATAGALGLRLQMIQLTDGDHAGPEGMKSLEEQGKDERGEEP